MGGVAFSVNAEAEHNVVTSMLALTAQAAAHEPEQRIEPVQSTSTFRDDLCEPVVPFDVRKLVDENDADPLLRPALGISRQQHATTKDAPCPHDLASVRL